jgi:hypothetical protein
MAILPHPGGLVNPICHMEGRPLPGVRALDFCAGGQRVILQGLTRDEVKEARALLRAAGATSLRNLRQGKWWAVEGHGDVIDLAAGLRDAGEELGDLALSSMQAGNYCGVVWMGEFEFAAGRCRG